GLALVVVQQVADQVRQRVSDLGWQRDLSALPMPVAPQYIGIAVPAHCPDVLGLRLGGSLVRRGLQLLQLTLVPCQLCSDVVEHLCGCLRARAVCTQLPTYPIEAAVQRIGTDGEISPELV